jgi:hypothetical protein
VLLSSPTDTTGIPIVYTSIIPNHVAVAKEIAAYANALNDVAKADSTAKVTAALNKVAATITTLSSAAFPAGGGPAAAAVVTPTANALSWIYGQYQEQFKLDALRKATQSADPLIQRVAVMYGNVGQLLGDVQTAELQKSFVEAKSVWFEHPSSATLQDYLNKADALDKQLTAAPAKMFTDMGTAHAKLTASLKDEINSFADAEVAIERLAADADAVYKIAQSFQKPAGK